MKNLTEKIKEIIKKNDLIQKNDHIIVGVSGGPDSVCLFHILLTLSKEIDFTLSAVHINHKYRPGAAEEDEAYVRTFCEKAKVPLKVVCENMLEVAKAQNLTPEEAGRKIRYKAFMDEAHVMASEAKQSSIKIAVAHNKNDQAETVLMRILRGTGTDGLAGIPLRRTDESGYEIIRPLLYTSRTEIEEYCKENNLSPRHDKTNDSPDYHRNLIRLKLIPEIEKITGQNPTEALSRLAENAAEDKDYFETETAVILRSSFVIPASEPESLTNCPLEIAGQARNDKSITLSLKTLQSLHPAVLQRTIKKAFAEAGLKEDITWPHLKAAETLIKKGETGKQTDFPNGYTLKISYNDVIIEPPTDRGTAADRGTVLLSGEATDERTVPLSAIPEGETVTYTAPNGETLTLDAAALDAAGLTPEWRTRRSGDRMWPEGMDGSKKLQDIFTDAKVPRDERESILLLAAKNEILWIPGQRKTRRYR